MRVAHDPRWWARGLRLNLATCSLAYLLVPLAIFFALYLRPVVGAPLFVLLAVTLVQLLQQAPPAGSTHPRLRAAHVLVALACALAWLSFSGIGHVGHQRWDFVKHNAVLKTLVVSPWPVAWTDPPYAFVYYIGWYLPAAVVGKLAGWPAAQLATFAWSAAGIVLVMLWVQRLVGRFSWTLPVIFVFLGGMDIVGYLLLHGHLPDVDDAPIIEWWSHYWGRPGDFHFFGQYGGSTTLLYNAPNQAIGGWIAAALVLHAIETGAYLRFLPVIFAALALWSPFATVGLVPFGLYALWRVPVRTWLASTGAVLSAATLVVLALFYAARAFPGEGGVVPELAKRALPLALFLAIELGAFYACIAFWIRRATLREKHIAGIALAALLCLPFIQYGAYNDWLMRASMPALFAVWILFLRAMEDRSVYAAACVVWLIGSAVAVAEIGMSGRNARVVLDNLDAVDTVDEMKIDPVLVRQYYGARESLFFRRIAPLD